MGASWLWTMPGPLGFHYGYRVGNLFISYESQEQFEPEADGLAARAAEEVRRLSDECSSLEKIATILLEKVAGRAKGNPIFHAGIAAGLVGQLAEAKQNFQTIEAEFTDGELRSAAITLKGLLNSPEAYVNAVEVLIKKQRFHNKLPELSRALPSQLRLEKRLISDERQ